MEASAPLKPLLFTKSDVPEYTPLKSGFPSAVRRMEGLSAVPWPARPTTVEPIPTTPTTSATTVPLRRIFLSISKLLQLSYFNSFARSAAISRLACLPGRHSCRPHAPFQNRVHAGAWLEALLGPRL